MTSTLRLHTGILVLPYRNPFIVARAAATLDVFSGGRLSLGVGAGYLKGEYYAVGAHFARRNDVMDEYIAAMKASWTGEQFDFAGTGYSARVNRIRPRPTQRPHPPLFIGGNSRRANPRAKQTLAGQAFERFLAFVEMREGDSLRHFKVEKFAQWLPAVLHAKHQQAVWRHMLLHFAIVSFEDFDAACTIARASSVVTLMSTRRCWSTWNFDRSWPNCWRVLR